MKVSWDDDIPNSMEKYNMFQTTNQNKPWFSSIPLLAPDLVVSIDIDHLEIPMQKWWQEFPIHTLRKFVAIYMTDLKTKKLCP